MNYFQLYETQRKRFSKGAKWIRWNGDIVEIIDTFEYSVSYKSMTGRFIVTGRSKDIFYTILNLTMKPQHELLSTL